MSDDEYERGKVQGRTDSRLDDHDDHFAKLNGSVVDLGGKVAKLTLAIQRLTDQGTARDATVITTAAALKDAETARRDKSDQTWSPFAKTITVLGLVIAALGMYLALRH
jgi:hypothetical protein